MRVPQERLELKATLDLKARLARQVLKATLGPLGLLDPLALPGQSVLAALKAMSVQPVLSVLRVLRAMSAQLVLSVLRVLRVMSGLPVPSALPAAEGMSVLPVLSVFLVPKEM